MNRNITLTVVSCLVLVALVFILTWYRLTGGFAKTMSAEELRDLGALVYEEPVQLRPFSLTDHTGADFSLQNLNGQWTLIFFGFTSCPDICPLTLTELNQFYRTLPEEFKDTKVVMVTVDPDRDTAEKLAAYMSSFHPDFIGVNGPYADIADLARQLFVAHSPPPSQAPADEHAGHNMASNPADYVIDHSGNVLIINPQGQYHGFFDAAIQDNELTLAYEAIRNAY